VITEVNGSTRSRSTCPRPTTCGRAFNLLANLKFWNSLPGDVQETVQRNVKKYVAMQRAYTDNLNRELGDKLAARGILQHRGRLDFPRQARRRLLPALEERVRADGVEPARARGRQARLTMQADIHYTVDTGEKLVNETFGPNNIRRRKSGSEQPYRWKIRTAGRRARNSPSTKPLASCSSSTKRGEGLFDPQQLESLYYPEVERLVKELSGARRVVVFDHNLALGR